MIFSPLFSFFFLSNKKLNLPFLIDLNYLPVTLIGSAWSCNACQNGNMREMSMRTTVLFFFFLIHSFHVIVITR